MTKPAPQPRGPNAERRAATRAKILEAAVRRIHEHGYAGATTPEVAKAAAVARGSLLHQFPTKVDLILAVAEYAARRQAAFIRENLMRRGTHRAQYIQVVDALWDALQRPEGVALIEIMLATRREPELAERYGAFAKSYEEAMRSGSRRLAGRLGIAGGVALEQMARFTLTALRGLAVETMFSHDPKAIAAAVALLKAQRAAFFDDAHKAAPTELEKTQ